jgi:hypothetical protein
MSPQRQVPQEDSPLLVVLGDIGDQSRLGAVKAGRLDVGEVELRILPTDSMDTLTPAEIGRIVAETEPGLSVSEPICPIDHGSSSHRTP